MDFCCPLSAQLCNSWCLQESVLRKSNCPSRWITKMLRLYRNYCQDINCSDKILFKPKQIREPLELFSSFFFFFFAKSFLDCFTTHSSLLNKFLFSMICNSRSRNTYAVSIQKRFTSVQNVTRLSAVLTSCDSICCDTQTAKTSCAPRVASSSR